MQGLIIYFSSYGTTKQYAEWIAQEIDVETRSYKDAGDAELQNADFLIIGSCVLAHKLIIAKWLIKKEPLLKGKKLFFYSVSGAIPGAKELDDIFTCSIPESLLKDAGTYQFGGKMRYQDLSRAHKIMMQIGALVEKDPDAKAEMKRDMKIAKNNINADYIKPLVKDFKLYSNPALFS